MLNGFIDDRHRQAFETARDRARRGGPDAICCGARLRSGGLCGHPPVEGSLRCRLHCGPVASRRLRDREIQRLATGDLDYETFVQNERRRAANKLQDVWKRAPWTPGATLDLGVHEQRFLDAMIFAGHRPERLAPAVLDACRWKWRRFVLDRRDNARWLEWAATELPRRIEVAGRPPAGWSPTDVSGVEPVFAVPNKVPGVSKRRTSDTRRVVQPRILKHDRRRGGALDAPAVAGELAEAAHWFAVNRHALNDLAAHVMDERSLLVLWRGAMAAQRGDYSVWETARGMLA